MKDNNSEVSGWVGWVGFAGIMLYLAGFFHLIEGFVALFKDTVYVVGEKNLWAFDYTQWGWFHIIGGIILILAAGSLVSGKGFGRTVAVLAALGSASLNMLFVPVYPIWSIISISICVLVIYAVIVHGGDVKKLK